MSERDMPPVRKVLPALARIKAQHQSEEGLKKSGQEPGEAVYQSRPLQIRQQREAAAATRIQKALRGYQARKHYRVKSDPDVPGIIHSRIHGTSEHFERVGFQVADRRMVGGRETGQEHTRTMDIMSIDPNRFQGSVHGGDRLATAEQIAGGLPRPEGSPTAYINASYFNYGDYRDPDKPEFRPFGETRVDGKKVKARSVPKPYRKQYGAFQPEGSKDRVTTGPVLASMTGKRSDRHLAATFTEDIADEDKFRYRDESGNTFPGSSKPGYLHHAGDPNDRAAISWPMPMKSRSGRAGPADPDATPLQDRVRMMTIRAPRRGGGFTLPELSQAAARVTSWNRSPEGALNLDGGGSTSMGVVKPDGSHVAYGGYHGRDARRVSTIIAYQSKPDKGHK